MIYRKEIDGLRALAVLVVIFFHAGLDLFSGGFVGVDVFFVISGYLISSLIIEDIENKKFNISDFYHRRLRRLLPALFVVMFISLPFAWFLMSPSQMKDFSQSLIAVSLFGSNFLFWKEHGYFQLDAKEKPFLHTWSLGVEEQFYFIFPLLILVIWRFGKNNIFWLIVFVAFLSLMLSQWGPSVQSTANFYLLPTRLWEILSGSIVAFIINKKGIKSNNYLAALGLVAIMYSSIIYTEKIQYPSFYTLLPVTGTMAILIFADKKTYIAKCLSYDFFVKIGLVSYSAYLWHQPIFAFAKIYFEKNLSIIIIILLIIITIIFAFLSWRFIEKPFRKLNGYSKKQIFIFSSVGIIFFISIGAILLKTELFHLKFSDNQRKFLKNREISFEMLKSANDIGGCFLQQNQSPEKLIERNCIKTSSKQRVIVFGDSVAAQYYDALKLFEEELNIDIMQFTGTSCRAFKAKSTQRCKDFYEIFTNVVIPKLNEKDILIISSNWWWTLKKWDKDYSMSFEKSIIETIKNLKFNVKDIVLIGNAPGFFKPYDLLLEEKYEDNIYIPSYGDYNTSDTILQQISLDYNLVFIKPTDLLCKNEKCLFIKDKKYLYMNESYFSVNGAKIIAKQLLDKYFDIN